MLGGFWIAECRFIMAFIGNKILLGYEDEPLSEKYKGIVDFKTNKVGGKPVSFHLYFGPWNVTLSMPRIVNIFQM